VNYRHHFHAGNYADVFKHVLLAQLVRAMQRKERGILYLDTHAGRGSYDLTEAPALPGGRTREPEWPAGIGRVWTRAGAPEAVADFLNIVRELQPPGADTATSPLAYPGSPLLAAKLARAQDRLALCELREDDAEALDLIMGRTPNCKAHRMDGYTALKAMLPPPEKRGLVLIDPPFESQAEFADIRRGLGEALRRFPSGVYAVWYPITERARTEEFLADVARDCPVLALAAELSIAGDSSQLRMKGCGLLVLNPPWRIEDEFKGVLPWLREALAVDNGAATRVAWVVPER